MYEQKPGSSATLKFESILPDINDHKEDIFNMWICCFIFVKENPISGEVGELLSIN